MRELYCVVVEITHHYTPMNNNNETEENVCEFCNDTGEVSVMEQVYANEPHMASTGTEVCICRLDLNK